MVAPSSLTDGERNSGKGHEGVLTNGVNQLPETDNVCNGNDNVKEDFTVTDSCVNKPPSYVSLACCISGYTTLSYDTTRQRQTLRSLSPIRPPDRVNQNVETYTSGCGNYLSPFSNQSTLKTKMQTQDKGIEFLNGKVLHSPRHISNITMSKDSLSYTSNSMFPSDNFSYSNVSTSVSSSQSPLKMSYISNYSTATSSLMNVNESRLITPTKVGVSSTPGCSPSSFILQRVERLYGPAALAQGFYTPRRRNKPSLEQKEDNTIRSEKGREALEKEDLPVLKLLRPEFRAQLSLASRKSRITDNPSPQPSGQINGTDKFETTKIMNNSSIDEMKEEQKDGHYFLKRLNDEVRELERLAGEAEEELEKVDSEEGAGILRAVAGKARLLVAQKLHQFRGLCNNNMKQSKSECFPTTNEDLAGFWDMVMIQVKQVQDQFKELEILRANNWATPERAREDASARPDVMTSGGNKTPLFNNRNIGGLRKGGLGKKQILLGGGEGASEASKARDQARRKLIEEKRKAMREARKAKEGGDGPEETAKEGGKEVEEVTAFIASTAINNNNAVITNVANALNGSGEAHIVVL